MKLKQSNGRWVFTGRIPMALARKSWDDQYAAVRAAEREGFSVMANGTCVPDPVPADRVKSEDGLESRSVDGRPPTSGGVA